MNQPSDSIIRAAMALLGRKGGASKSPAKVAAARANMAKAQAKRRTQQTIDK